MTEKTPEEGKFLIMRQNYDKATDITTLQLVFDGVVSPDHVACIADFADVNNIGRSQRLKEYAEKLD